MAYVLDGMFEMRAGEPELSKAEHRMILRQALLAFCAAVLLVSAVGIWLVPGGGDDAALRLIKLLVSGLMVALALVCRASLRADRDEPELHLDLAQRRLRVVERDAAGRQTVTGSYGFEALTELCLRDGFLTARDRSGELILAAPVPDRATEAAIRRALSGTA